MKNIYYEQEKIDKLYPGATIIPPQRIGQFPGTRGITLEQICTNGQYFAETKKDGYCYIYNKTKSGKSYLFSRSVSRTTGLPSEKSANVPHIMKAMDEIFPNDTIIVGEIYYPNKISKDVTTIMGCLPKKAVERQKNNPIHFYLHDILLYDGKNAMGLGALERYYILKHFLELGVAAKLNNVLPHFLELADCFYNCNLLEIAAEQLAKGEEGIVLKKIGGVYHPGSRPAWETIKIKKTDTVDVICMGFEEPTKEYNGLETSNYWVIEEKIEIGGKEIWAEIKRGTGKKQILKCINCRTIEVTKPYYYNWKTAIKIGLYKDKELISIGTVSSGLTDFYREDFSKNSDKYIGKVIEVKIMEKGDGALRHPIFMKFRDDKNAEECLYTDVFN